MVAKSLTIIKPPDGAISPRNGWFLSWKIPSWNGRELGVPPCQETSRKNFPSWWFLEMLIPPNIDMASPWLMGKLSHILKSYWSPPSYKWIKKIPWTSSIYHLQTIVKWDLFAPTERDSDLGHHLVTMGSSLGLSITSYYQAMMGYKWN